MLHNSAEKQITNKLNILGKEICKKKLNKIKDLQLEFIAKSIVTIKMVLQNELINTSLDLCELFGYEIQYNNKMHSIPPNGLIIISNHIGLNKLTKINHKLIIQKLTSIGGKNKIEQVQPLLNDDPFLLLFAPLIVVAKKLSKSNNIKIILICTKFPEPYSNIIKKSGGIILDPTIENQYKKLLHSARKKVTECLQNSQIPVFIMFPEGGTSGKTNNDSPYSLLNFKTGYARLSRDLTINSLPVVVSLNQQSKLDITILKTVSHSEIYDVNTIRSKMQSIIDKITCAKK